MLGFTSAFFSQVLRVAQQHGQVAHFACFLRALAMPFFFGRYSLVCNGQHVVRVSVSHPKSKFMSAIKAHDIDMAILAGQQSG